MQTKMYVHEAIRQYLTAKFGRNGGGCIQLPDRLSVYHHLADLLEKRPAWCCTDYGNLTIQLPNRRGGKHPQTYNYLSTAAQRILTNEFRVMLLADFHEFTDKKRHLNGWPIIKAVRCFTERYGITALSEDAFVKNYYRWRNAVRNQGGKRAYNKKKQQRPSDLFRPEYQQKQTT